MAALVCKNGVGIAQFELGKKEVNDAKARLLTKGRKVKQGLFISFAQFIPSGKLCLVNCQSSKSNADSLLNVLLYNNQSCFSITEKKGKHFQSKRLHI